MAKTKNEITKKVKKLTPAELKKQGKKLEGQFEVNLFIDDEVYVVKIDEHFKKTKIFKLLDDMVEFYNEASKRADSSMLELVTPYSSLLLIKYFTDIEISDDINEALATLDLLIDLELLDKILNAMPEKEVEKVYKVLTDMLKNVERNLEEAEKEAEKLENQIQNPEVKGMIQ